MAGVTSGAAVLDHVTCVTAISSCVRTHLRKRTMAPQALPFVCARLSPASMPLIMNSPLLSKWRDVSMSINAGLEANLVQLVEIRASQINGCANCINMHTKEARSIGESEQRIYLLPTWREAPCYSERERAALGWTEAMMRISEGQRIEAAHYQVEVAHEALKQHFTEEEQVKLTLVLIVINGWNLLSVGFGLFVDQAPTRAAA